MSKSVVCFYNGLRSNCDPSYDDLDPNMIPDGCNYILFIRFSINQSSLIYVNDELLKKTLRLNIPIILPVTREENYSGWTALLSEDGNENDAKVLCDFAKTNNIKGYIFYNTAPGCNEATNKNIAKYIIPYLQQIKKFCPPGFIIGLGISVDPNTLKNTDIYNFEALNDVVTYYELDTMELNKCNPKLYNGVTPITTNASDGNSLRGLEDVVIDVKETAICFEKLVFSIPVFTVNNTDDSYPAYTKMCEGKTDKESINNSCIQTSQNYYDKGKYLQALPAGITVSGLDWDDYGNTCKCKSAFNGFYNILAGYRSGSVIPCAMFDVQSTVYPIK
ncbi:unnamed protein product [Aphis gossypii]|nr:unnamed protein product [Aphis gossypii]